MADKTVVPEDVLPSTGALVQQGIAAVALTQGQNVYATDANPVPTLDILDPTDPAKSTYRGTTINAAAAGQRIDFVNADLDFNPGFACTYGQVYMASQATPGAFADDEAPDEDVTKTVLGIGKANGKMNLSPILAGAPPV